MRRVKGAGRRPAVLRVARAAQRRAPLKTVSLADGGKAFADARLALGLAAGADLVAEAEQLDLLAGDLGAFLRQLHLGLADGGVQLAATLLHLADLLVQRGPVGLELLAETVQLGLVAVQVGAAAPAFEPLDLGLASRQLAA